MRDAKVVKWGNSLAVRLPQAFAAKIGGSGTTVMITMSELQHKGKVETVGGFSEREQSTIGDDVPEALIGNWGNSLAVRLPAEITKALGLKAGDMLSLTAENAGIEVARQQTRAEAVESFLSLRGLVTGSVRFPRQDLLLRGRDVEE